MSFTKTKLAAVLFASIFLALPLSSASAQNLLVSRMGAKCLDVEGGIGQGKRLIGYACSGTSNQKFTIESGQVKVGGYCVDARGGLGRDNDEIILWTCARDAKNQQWALRGDRLVGINGKCIVLKGGSGWWNLPFNNQPAILFQCNNTENEYWYQGAIFPASRIVGGNAVNSGALGSLTPSVLSYNGTGLIGQDGAGVLAQAARIVSGGAGNIVSGGAGNIVSGGAGNIVSGGAGNVIVMVRSGN